MTNTLTINQVLQQAVAHHTQGHLQEAEELYRAILQVQPDHPDANNNLGVLVVQMNRPVASLPYFKAAVEANPNQVQYLLSYIDALIQADQINVARQALEQARQQGLQEEGLDALIARIEGCAQVTEQSNAEAVKETPPISSAVLQNSKKKSKTNLKKLAKKSALLKRENPSSQEINTLVVLFNEGRNTELLSLAQVMTERFPLHGFGWKMLGVVLQQMGRITDSLTYLQKAALLLPSDFEVHYNLGNILRCMERLDEAVECYRRTLQIKPYLVEALYNLGVTLQLLGRLDEAEVNYQRALKINPRWAEVINNLGNIHHARGRLNEAEGSYRRALRINPDYAEAHYNLGNTLKDQDRLDEAEVSFQRALQIKPVNDEAYSNLGAILLKLGRLGEAEVSLQRALQIKSDNAVTHYNLGSTLHDLGRLDEAEASYRRALQIKPDNYLAYNNLGITLYFLDRLDEAEASLRRALEINPENAQTHSNLGFTLEGQGRLDEAEASYRRALEIKPDFTDAHSNLLFCLDRHPDLSAAEIYLAYQEYDQRHGIPLRSVWCGHNNDRSPDRRLRIGYVSPDFRFHVCRLYVEPLLAHHDKTQVEVYAYAELVKEDAVSASYKNYVEHWIPTKGMSDEALAERIRSDGIDILVDLAGHTASNRLQVFARKPAPVSLSWIIGSGNTTGLSAIDYLLADEALIPIGSEGLFTEQPWRMATPAYCYRPNEGMGDVNALPAQQRGYITFGVLTRQQRINHHTIRVWSELLKSVPNARLVIDSSSYKSAEIQEQLASRFAEHGIPDSRLDIGNVYTYPWEALREIDISLDTFPNNTGTSLLVSLYMGVPFITLAARPSLGRFGVHNLQCVGHPELIAWSEEEYIAKAVALANDLGRLAACRASLRSEMELSPLLDEMGFARRVEEAYRSMWKIWCEKGDKT